VVPRRFLGELDAAADNRLGDHFVPQSDLQDLLSPESHIIFGAKGVGKTAMRRALTELNPDAFYAAGTIDLDNLSFAQVHAQLSRLSEVTGTEVMALARSTWVSVLAMYGLEILSHRIPGEDGLQNQIQRMLRDESFLDRTANNRVLNQIHNFLTRVGSFAFADASEVSFTARAEEQRNAVSRFFASGESDRLLQSCAEIIAASRKTVAICIDGFDSIVDHAPESRRAVFAGLIAAIFQLSKHPHAGRVFSFKAFLPRELAQEAIAVVWDDDKHLYNTRMLHWSEQSLEDFIAKRLAKHLPGPERSDQSFRTVWPAFMPLKINNTVHSVKENTFSYILRHTQFRPRQLLFQVQRLLDDWDSKRSSFRLDASFIPKVLANSSRTLAAATVKQLEYARPGLESFMRSWSGSTSTISFYDCFSKIKRVFGVEDGIQARQIFDELRDFGVLGVSPRKKLVAGASSARFTFAFVGDGIVTKIQPADDDVIALCPMFSDYFACTPSQYGVVIPVGV
jgi:hypothetical protein